MTNICFDIDSAEISKTSVSWLYKLHIDLLNHLQYSCKLMFDPLVLELNHIHV